VFNAVAVSSVTYGGTAMTLVDTTTMTSGSVGGSSGNAYLARYRLSAVAAGANTLTVTLGSTAPFIPHTMSYTVVGSVGTAQKATGSTSPLSQTVTCASGQRVLQSFAAVSTTTSPVGGNLGGAFTSVSGGTNRYNQVGGTSTSLSISDSN